MKPISESKAMRLGVLLIIIGAFIPSILYPFTSLTRSALLDQAALAMKGVSHDTGLRDLEIVLVKGEWKEDNKNDGSYDYEGRLAISYRYTVAFGILLAFIGIGLIALYKNKKKTD